MKSPHTIWASVAVIFMLLLSAVTLVALDKDVSIILTLAGLVAVPILGAFGVAIYQKMDQVKDNSNGTLNTLLDMQQKTQYQLHTLAMAMTPPPVPTPPHLPPAPEEKKEDTW